MGLKRGWNQVETQRPKRFSHPQASLEQEEIQEVCRIQPPASVVGTGGDVKDQQIQPTPSVDVAGNSVFTGLAEIQRPGVFSHSSESKIGTIDEPIEQINREASATKFTIEQPVNCSQVFQPRQGILRVARF